MNETTLCPECKSENVVFSKKRGIHVCEDCNHEFTLEKPFVQKRLFISYGHDKHASLAVRLRDDLKRRGHYIWFDEQRLLPGYDWEAFIEQGIEHLAADKANSAVILLLTPHSVRRPDGYCLNEVARALSRGLRIIPVMVVESEPPLSICRIQWLDMRECIPITEKEALYLPRFERLLQAIEENKLDFEGSQQRLIKALQPLEFDAEILRHLSKFSGRQWVFEKVDAWLAENPPKQRIFWISGGPGVGKTALSAVLSSRYREVAALHLCKFGHAQKSEPRCVVTSLAYQLSTQLSEYEAHLALMDIERLAQDDASTMFDNIIVQPLSKLTQPTRPIALLIDALDEASKGENNELANFIRDEFKKTPSWLRLIVTSRPEAAVTVPLQANDPFILDVEAESNRADIRLYLRRELASHFKERVDADRIVRQILEKSEGLFLYVEIFCDDVQQGRLSLERPEQFPQGLGGTFSRYFQRQFPDLEKFRQRVRPSLRAILASREPLPVDILQELFHLNAKDEFNDFIRPLGALFPVTVESNREVIKPYHKSIADWLTDETKAGPYFVSAVEGFRLLGEYCYLNWAKGSPFAMNAVTYNLMQSGQRDKVAALLLNPSFLEAKLRSGSKFREDLKLFSDGFIPSKRLESSTIIEDFSDKSLEESSNLVRAIFSIGVFLLFSLPHAAASVAALREFIEKHFDSQVLESKRQTISAELSREKAVPQVSKQSYNYYAANTGHYLQIYTVQSLEAVDAALALEPNRLKELLWSALRSEAIYSCDGDPSGAVQMAIDDAKEDMDSKLPLWQKTVLRLSACLAKR